MKRHVFPLKIYGLAAIFLIFSALQIKQVVRDLSIGSTFSKTAGKVHITGLVYYKAVQSQTHLLGNIK